MGKDVFGRKRGGGKKERLDAIESGRKSRGVMGMLCLSF